MLPSYGGVDARWLQALVLQIFDCDLYNSCNNTVYHLAWDVYTRRLITWGAWSHLVSRSCRSCLPAAEHLGATISPCTMHHIYSDADNGHLALRTIHSALQILSNHINITQLSEVNMSISITESKGYIASVEQVQICSARRGGWVKTLTLRKDPGIHPGPL